jgi:hypothetical protein
MRGRYANDVTNVARVSVLQRWLGLPHQPDYVLR